MQHDEEVLRQLGYKQELLRRMSGFSNYAISLSMICVLAGGITSFHQGLCSVGGAAIGFGWPLVLLFSLAVAGTMGQVASSFPTAGGLYHWASILGGRGWGWFTAWINLVGLVTVLAAVNLGTVLFLLDAFGLEMTNKTLICLLGVALITASQALINHLGIRWTTWLTDFSGYWILCHTALLTAALLVYAGSLDYSRLIVFTNYSGAAGGNVWPQTPQIGLLFLLGFLLPIYTITGFDASAHTAEETLSAGVNVPRGIVRSVLVSGVAGWLMLGALILAAPSIEGAAAHGSHAFFWIVQSVLPPWLVWVLFIGIALAQYLCGLAGVTSASRMVFAFARDGGLPCSESLRKVSPRYRTPTVAIWSISAASIAFTLYTPIYETAAAVCSIFLYLSYVVPTGLGIVAHGKTWTKMGPWSLGRWYRPLAVLSVVGCGLLVFIAVQPPNDKGLYIVGGVLALLGIVWWSKERHRFKGPPKTHFTVPT